MIVRFSPKFEKHFENLHRKIQDQFKKRLKLFLEKKAKEINLTADKIGCDDKAFPEIIW